MYKKIHFIINPASGNDEPILSWLSDIFSKTSIQWDVSVTKESGDARRFTREAIINGVDCVAAYGGDGTAMEVAEELYRTNIPLAIIPGGTANVLAKELGIPVDTKAALAVLTGESSLKRVDMGLCNQKPFIIRINIGLMADMVEETDRSLKEKVGQLAYAVTAVSQMKNVDVVSYTMILDGKTVSAEGISLVIANSGNVGIPNISLLPTIDIQDGLLDVILLKTKDLGSLVKWAASMAVGAIPEEVVEHWKAKKIVIQVPSSQTVIIDDRSDDTEPQTPTTLEIEIAPQSLSIVAPIP